MGPLAGWVDPSPVYNIYSLPSNLRSTLQPPTSLPFYSDCPRTSPPPYYREQTDLVSVRSDQSQLFRIPSSSSSSSSDRAGGNSSLARVRKRISAIISRKLIKPLNRLAECHCNSCEAVRSGTNTSRRTQQDLIQVEGDWWIGSRTGGDLFGFKEDDGPSICGGFRRRESYKLRIG
ncbi:hypothetical protein JCM3765_003768 [Sporobolomyces pararoseus]